MKKIIISLMLLVSYEAMAQQLTVSNVEALPGETVSFAMKLDTKGGSYTGMEFDILFPREGFTTTGVGTTTRTGWDGAYTIGDVGGVGIDYLARAGVLSYSATEIPGEGLLDFGTVEFQVAGDVPLGTYTVSIQNIVLIGEGRTPVSSTTFVVKVVNKHAVVLDETFTTAPASATNVDVRVRRSIKADEWSTLCLPFAMDETQVKAAFGDDVQLAEFKGWTATDWDADDNTTAIEVTFANASAIAANKPYIIKVSQAVSEFTVDGVDIDAEDEPSVTVGKVSKGTFGSFTGSYVPVTIDEECLFLSENKFWYSVGKTKMKGFRAYFYFQDLLAGYSSGNSAKIGYTINDETTSLNEELRMKSEESYHAVYDLQGRKVQSNKVTKLQSNTLPKGIYIHNGKKVVVK